MFFNYISIEGFHDRRLEDDILNENSLQILEEKGIQSIIFSNRECFRLGEINFAFS